MSDLPYAVSNNPKLPCPYCCGWRTVDPDDINSDAYPIEADGTRIPVLYIKPHRRCQANVDAYLAERDAEGLNL